jgi:5-methylcytosine-specific restriction endonuclease McrA
MKRPNVPATKDLEAVIDDLHEIEKALAELRQRLREVVKALAEQVPDDEIADAISYLYWNVPELKPAQISEAFLGQSPQKIEFRRYIKAVHFDFKCDRCGKPLPVSSRSQVSKYLRIQRDDRPRWAEGYRLVCETCEKAILAQRNREDRAREQALTKRLQELRSMPYSEYLRTPEWQARRQQHLRSAGYRCQVCNNTNTRLNVHHRTYERRGQELYKDLIVLCEQCHELFHKEGKLAPD